MGILGIKAHVLEVKGWISVKRVYFTDMCSDSAVGSYLRLINFGIA